VRVLYLLLRDHRAIELAKAKRNLKWQRNPEGMRLRILAAAKRELAAHGLAGARVAARVRVPDLTFSRGI